MRSFEGGNSSPYKDHARRMSGQSPIRAWAQELSTLRGLAQRAPPSLSELSSSAKPIGARVKPALALPSPSVIVSVSL